MDHNTEAELELLELLRDAPAGTSLTISIDDEGVFVGGTFPSMARDQKLPDETAFLGKGKSFDDAWLDMVPEDLRSIGGAVEIPDADVTAAVNAWQRQRGHGVRLRVVGKPRLYVVASNDRDNKPET